MQNQAVISSTFNFPPTVYARFPVERLSPEQIDLLLANGYFRNGREVVSSIGRSVNGAWKPCRMLRIPLADFSWKKRSRKLLRRNGKVFALQFGPFRPRTAVDELWAEFKTSVHGWENVSTLAAHLYRGLPPENFHTHELAVYEGEKLVAFSVFDLGLESMASMEAAYHLDYQRFSLGYCTMLWELEFALAKGVKWYYPGFLPKGVPMFDYKLRPGGAEYFCLKNKEWKPWGEAGNEEWLFEKLENQLDLAFQLLPEKKVKAEKVKRFIHHVPGQFSQASDHFSFLEMIKQNGKRKYRRIRLCYDVMDEIFRVFSQDLELERQVPKGEATQPRLVPIGRFIMTGASPDVQVALDLFCV